MSTSRNELFNQLREALNKNDIVKIDQILTAAPHLLLEEKSLFIYCIFQKNNIKLLEYFTNRYKEIGLDIRDDISKSWVICGFEYFDMAKRLVEMGMLEKYELNNSKGITLLFQLENFRMPILDYYAKNLRVEALQFVIELCRTYKIDIKPFLSNLLHGVTEAQHTEENQDKLSAFNYLIKVWGEEQVPISSALVSGIERWYHREVLRISLLNCLGVYYYHPEQNLAVIKQIIGFYRTANLPLKGVLEDNSYKILFNALENGDSPLAIFLLEVYAQEFKLEDILQIIMQRETTLGRHFFSYLVIHPDSLEVLQYIVNLCDEKIPSEDKTSLIMRRILFSKPLLRTAIESGNIKAIQYILAYCQKKCPQENLGLYFLPHIYNTNDFDVTKFLVDYCQENNYEMTTEICRKGFSHAAITENIPALHFFAEICKQKGISLVKEVRNNNFLMGDVAELNGVSKSRTISLLRAYLLREDPDIFALITQSLKFFEIKHEFDAMTLDRYKLQAKNDFAYAEARIKYHDQIKFIRSLGVPRESSYPPTEPMKVKRKKEQKEKADVIIKLILMMKGLMQEDLGGRPALPEELVYVIGEFVLGRELSFLRQAKRHLFFAGGFASLLNASKLIEVMEPDPGTPDQTKHV